MNYLTTWPETGFMSGTIGGTQVTHDLVAGWVLGHQYLRFHEVAREVDSEGVPLMRPLSSSVGIGSQAGIHVYGST